MSILSGFKLHKTKVISSLVFVALVILIFFFLNSNTYCKACVAQACFDYAKYNIFAGCHCNCQTLGAVITVYVIFLVVPFLFFYILYSIIETLALLLKRK